MYFQDNNVVTIFGSIVTVEISCMEKSGELGIDLMVICARSWGMNGSG